MKSKKIVAGILAAAITVSSIVPEAFASIIGSDNDGYYFVDVADLMDDSIDISDVYGAKVRFTDESADIIQEGAGGTFVFSSDTENWDQLVWCIGCGEGETHDICWDSETNSVTRMEESPFFTEENLSYPGYARICLEQLWGDDINIKSISLLDKDGNELTSKDMPDNPAPGDSSGEVPEPGEDESDYTYNVLDGGTIEITGYNGNGGNVAIPAEIDGKKVTKIGNSAFSGCVELTSVTIPDSVIYIDEYAFFNCTNLTSVVIPDSVTNIDFNAFFNCKSLKSVTIPASVIYIGNEAFGCYEGYDADTDSWVSKKVDGFKINYVKNTCGHMYALENGFSDEIYLVTNELDDGTLEITEYAGNSATYVIPGEIDGKKVTKIGGNAFYRRSELTSVTIPDSVTSIDGRTFYGCTSLKEVTISASVIYIGNEAFGYYEVYDAVTDSYKSKKIDGFKINYVKNTYGHIYAVKNGFSDETCLITTELDDGTLEITKYAGNSATYVIPGEIDGKKVTSIDNYAFSGCTELTSVTIPDCVTNIGWQAFYNCTSLKSVTIPASVTSIGDEAFGYYEGYDADTVSWRAKKVDGFEINYVKNTMGHLYATQNGFTDEACLITNELDDGTLEITKYAGNSATYIIPDEIDGKKVAQIGNYAFNDCTGLTSVTISHGVRSIGDGTFFYCTNLTSVTIPDSVTYIGEDAFRDCTSLKSVTIPASVIYIGNEAFGYYEGYDADTDSWVSKKVDGFKINYVKNAYGHMYALENGFSDEIYLITNELDDGTLEIDRYAGNSATYEIPAEIGGKKVTGIKSNAFSGCTEMTSVTIPDSVTYIDYSAFYNCTSLKEVNIPASVNFINDIAFGYYSDDNFDTRKIDNFKIYCYSGTAGEQYAKDNDFEYELLECKEHKFGDWTISKAASCTEDGEKVRICSVCNETETETIPATGHTEVIDEAVAATCTKIGFTEGKHCSVCNTVIKAQEVIPAKGHTEVVDKAVAATCTKTGLTEGKHCSVCNAVIKAQEVVPAHGHTEVIDKAVAATCTKTGLTEGKHCSVCNAVIKAQETVPATGHKYIDTVVKPTYTAQGYTLHKCSVCGTSYKDTYTAKLTLAKVTGVKLGGRAADALRINWSKNASADGYIVEMYQGNKWVRIAKITNNNTTTFRKAGLKASTVYKFRVKAYKMSGKTAVYSAYSTELAARTNPSVMTGAKLSGRAADALRINWSKNASADGYIVEMYQGNKWVRVAKITNNNTTTFRKAGLKASTVYKFRVKAYKMSGSTALYGNYSATVTTMTNPSVVKGAKLTGRAADALRINWTKNTTADGYIVEMYKGGKWVRAAKITKNSTTTYRASGLKASTVYKFRVKAYKMSGKTALYGNYSATVTARTNPSVVKGVKIAGKAKDALRVNWTKNTSAQGYIVEMYKGGKWVRVAKITNSNTTTYRKAGLAKNTAYKFRVRAYHMSGKTALYGNYGSVSGKTAVK